MQRKQLAAASSVNQPKRTGLNSYFFEAGCDLHWDWVVWMIFFFVVVITCTFTAERKFPHCLCSMTHLCPNRGKNISKRDRLKVKRVWFLGRLLRKRHCRAFFCEAFSHVHRAWNSCQPNQTVFTRWPCHTGEKCEAGSPGELPCLSANRLSLNFLR